VKIQGNAVNLIARSVILVIGLTLLWSQAGTLVTLAVVLVSASFNLQIEKEGEK
jgi:hypothetical protein